MTEPTSPAALGYRMPAEWEPHRATWLTWPRPDGISFPDRYESAPPYWVKMCQILREHEEVHVNVFNEALEEDVTQRLLASGIRIGDGVFLHKFPAYEPWCRDHGPIFIKQTRSAQLPPTAIVDWGYNAWGGKYPPFDLDDAIPQRVAELLNFPLYSPGIVMEGGALEVNGKGTLLTTEACLLNPNRNPGFTQSQIEKYLSNFLGVNHFLWLGDGIEGDDTDGHVDDLTRFVDDQTVVTIVEHDTSDMNYDRLQENLKRLQSMKDQDHHPLRVVELPTPGYIEYDGQRLPASYANFYIANQVVLLPIYGHANDRIAQETLQKLFPTRKVIPINCMDLLWGLGAFHCVTQQQPL